LDTFGLDAGQVDPPAGFPAELALPAFDCQVGQLYEPAGMGYWPGVDGRWRHDCLATVSQAAFDGGVDTALAEIAAGLEAQGLTVSAPAQCRYPVPDDPEVAALAEALGPLTYVVVTGLADGGVAAVYAMKVNMGEPGYVGPNTSAWSVSVYFRPDGAS
jgi:hypothetical protein